MNFYSLTGILKYILNIKPSNIFPPHLYKVDTQPVPDAPHEIRLFMVVRNESQRLPYLFKYYFSRGVDRIFVIDNDSQDGTRSFLLSQKRTHVFHTKESFIYFWDWVYILLGRYGVGHWCVFVDADEILVYPYWERLSIRNLCDFLAQEGYDALHGMLLDMYSDRPICETEYASDSDLLTQAPYFDPDTHYTKYIPFASQRYTFWGGVRRRIFGINPCLSKIPIFRFNPHMSLFSGGHFINGAAIADIGVAVLHFKYFNDFIVNAINESQREKHWNNAVQYKAYAKKLRHNSRLSFYCCNSVRFVDSQQLISLGVMKASPKLETFVKSLCR